MIKVDNSVISERHSAVFCAQAPKPLGNRKNMSIYFYCVFHKLHFKTTSSKSDDNFWRYSDVSLAVIGDLKKGFSGG